MISLGIQMGGPEQMDSPIRIMLLKAQNIAAKSREPNYDDGVEAWINPIFIVPGSIWKPEFSGYELGHFSRKRKGLVVQIAVPQSVTDGKAIKQFICESLREAAHLGSLHFASKGISFSPVKAGKIILAIENALEESDDTMQD